MFSSGMLNAFFPCVDCVEVGPFKPLLGKNSGLQLCCDQSPMLTDTVFTFFLCYHLPSPSKKNPFHPVCTLNKSCPHSLSQKHTLNEMQMGQKSRKGELDELQQKHISGFLKNSAREAIFQWEEDVQGSEVDT